MHHGYVCCFWPVSSWNLFLSFSIHVQSPFALWMLLLLPLLWPSCCCCQQQWLEIGGHLHASFLSLCVWKNETDRHRIHWFCLNISYLCCVCICWRRKALLGGGGESGNILPVAGLLGGVYRKSWKWLWWLLGVDVGTMPITMSQCKHNANYRTWKLGASLMNTCSSFLPTLWSDFLIFSLFNIAVVLYMHQWLKQITFPCNHW